MPLQSSGAPSNGDQEPSSGRIAPGRPAALGTAPRLARRRPGVPQTDGERMSASPTRRQAALRLTSTSSNQPAGPARLPESARRRTDPRGRDDEWVSDHGLRRSGVRAAGGKITITHRVTPSSIRRVVHRQETWMVRQLTAIIEREGDGYVALCPDCRCRQPGSDGWRSAGQPEGSPGTVLRDRFRYRDSAPDCTRSMSRTSRSRLAKTRASAASSYAPDQPSRPPFTSIASDPRR